MTTIDLIFLQTGDNSVKVKNVEYHMIPTREGRWQLSWMNCNPGDTFHLLCQEH